MTYIAKQVENDEAILKIIQDDDAPNPRKDFDNFGHMICWHRNYNLGDDHSYSEPRQFLEELAYDLESGLEEDIMEDMYNKDLLEIIQKYAVILPLYLYDHSGITMNTTGFSCRWDSGQVGWTYITYSEIEKIYGSLDLDKAENLLRDDVKVYDQYLTGDVYYFLLEDKEDGIVIDTCGGFFGLEYLIESIGEHIAEDYADLVEQIKTA